MNLRSKASSLTEQTAAKHRMLELNVRINLSVGADATSRGDSYYGEKELGKVDVSKTLVSTTDSKLKDIKAEIIASIESQFDEIEKVIDNSNRLTDGFWSTLNKLTEPGNPLF